MRCPTLTPKARSASLSCSAARPSPSHTCSARKRSRSTQERRIDVFVSRVRAFAPWPFAYTIYILHFAASCVATRDQQILIRHDSLRFSWCGIAHSFRSIAFLSQLHTQPAHSQPWRSGSTRGGPDISSPISSSVCCMEPSGYTCRC